MKKPVLMNEEAEATSEQTGAWFMPAPGCRVRKPDGSLLAETGEQLPDEPYYARLIAAGDLVPAERNPA